MFRRRRKHKKGGRKEPRFEETGGRVAGGELRADPRDRIGVPAGAAAGRPKQAARPRAKAGATGAGTGNGAGNGAGNGNGQRTQGGTQRRPPARRPKTRRPTAKSRGRLARGAKRALYWASVAAVWCGLILTGIVIYYGASLPAISDLEVPERSPNLVIKAATGETLATRGIGHGRDMRLKELPAYLPQAIIAIEDRRFYWHFGIDPIGLVRAGMRNMTSGRVVQGGSTLTQQLAKNLFLKPERTMRRKVQEMILAFWLEAKYSKAEILELYLNRAYFGAGTYGVEAGAQHFFNKSARAVTVSEAAVLAGLLKAPSRYAPTRNPKLAQRRAAVVIAEMVEAGYLSAEEGKTARDHPARLVRLDSRGAIDYAADWISDLLPGYVGQPTTDIIVETTLDPKLQAAAARAVQIVLEEEGEPLNASQGALIAMDRSGAIKAVVGGKSYAESQFNRAVKATRQPGSAFKPFVYLAALESGLTPDTVRSDEPVRFGKWAPKNYNKKYQGPVTLTEGLSNSINTVAARLANEVGIKRVIATARKLGITTPIRRDLSIALGTSEVTLLELTGAYVPFSNGGFGVLPYIIRRARAADGQVLYERSGSGPGQVISLKQAGAMNYMLQAALRTGTAKRAAFGNWPAGGKTGTTQDWKDAWFIGYTARLTAGVWIGNDDNSPMKRVSGGALPAMIWHRFMADAHEGLNPVPLPGSYWRNPDDVPPVAGIGPEDADPGREVPPYQQPETGASKFRINGDFLRRIFGG